MKSKVGRRILEETPQEIKIFVRKYAQIIARVHELMAKQGLNQGDLARLLDKRPSEISRWLNGEHNLTLKSLVRLEAELGQDIFLVHKVDGQHTDLPKQSLKPQASAAMSETSWIPLQAMIAHSPKTVECLA
jgi:transcriptional regulator with XRE-family HTH domain